MKRFKRLRFCLSVILLTILVSSGVLPATTKEHVANAATVAKINKSKLTLTIGESYLLKINGTKKSFKWVSSNKKVAKVSSIGNVTGLSAGSTIITAKRGNTEYKCKVTVKKRISVDENKINVDNYNYDSYVTFTVDKSTDDDVIKYSIEDGKIVACGWGDWEGNDITLFFLPLQDGTTTVYVSLNNDPDNQLEIEVTCSAGRIDKTLTKSDSLAVYGRMIAPYTLYYPDSLVINSISYGKDTLNNSEVVIFDINAKNADGVEGRLYEIFYYDSAPLKDRPSLYDSENNLYVNFYILDSFPTGIDTIGEKDNIYTGLLSNYFTAKGFCTIKVFGEDK